MYCNSFGKYLFCKTDESHSSKKNSYNTMLCMTNDLRKLCRQFSLLSKNILDTIIIFIIIVSLPNPSYINTVLETVSGNSI